MILIYISTIAIMIRWFIAASTGRFWQPAEFENVSNPDFENLKHLQNLGHFLMAEGSRRQVMELVLNGGDNTSVIPVITYLAGLFVAAVMSKQIFLNGLLIEE